MNRTNSRRLINAIFLVALMLVGCTSTGQPKMERNGSGDIIPYEGLVISHDFPWDGGGLEIIDDTHFRINFTTSPLLECERFGAKVEETQRVVSVTLLFGEISNARDLCKDEPVVYEMSSRSESIIIETSSPIGNRKIIDGAVSR